MGELLDAAVLLLRLHAGALLPLAAVLAGTEQLVLRPLRIWGGAVPPAPAPDIAEVSGAYWLVLAAGAGLEVVIILLLAAPASRAAAGQLIARPVANRTLLSPRGSRPIAVALLALFCGGLVAAASVGGPFWLVAYPFVMLVVPALVIDRVGPFRALGRGAAMAGRSSARGVWILLLAYLAWWIVRMIVGLGGGLALANFVPFDNTTIDAIATATRAAVNTLAYAVLACVAAVVHLEARMRTEGLDIMLSRAGRHGPLTTELLAARR